MDPPVDGVPPVRLALPVPTVPPLGFEGGPSFEPAHDQENQADKTVRCTRRFIGLTIGVLLVTRRKWALVTIVLLSLSSSRDAADIKWVARRWPG
jgi:hypothetical protein